MKLTKKHTNLYLIMDQFSDAMNSGNRRAAKRLIIAVLKFIGGNYAASSINKVKGRVTKNTSRQAKRMKNFR